MKKLLLITNLLTLSILAGLFIKRYIFKVNSRILNTQTTSKEPCRYELKHFDFHFKQEPDSPAVVMLGNSLIRWGNWDSLLNRSDVINRGISGDILRCICERLSYLKNIPARIYFIEGGINDLPKGNVDTLFKYYRDISRFLLTENKIPVINLVLYISPKAGETYLSRKDYKFINQSVKQLNNLLRAYAKDNKIDVIDMNETLSDNMELVLKNEYTWDGVHLTAAAYKKWGFTIQKILAKYGL